MSIRTHLLRRWALPAATSLAVNGVLLGMLVRLPAMPMPADEMSVAVTLRMPEGQVMRPHPQRPLVKEVARRAPVRTAVTHAWKPALRSQPAAVPPAAPPRQRIMAPPELAPALRQQAEVALWQPAEPAAQIALISPQGEGGGDGASAAVATPGGSLGSASGAGAGDGQEAGGSPGGSGNGAAGGSGQVATGGGGPPAAVAARGESRGPEVARQTRPVYPSAARSEGVEGTLALRVRLDAAGRVTDVSIERSSGDRRLDAAAERAVRQWTYRPRLKDGDAVASSLRVRVEFRLEPSFRH